MGAQDTARAILMEYAFVLAIGLALFVAKVYKNMRIEIEKGSRKEAEEASN